MQALLEGKPGTFSAEGIFALEPFFEAASQAGIYLLARPGPYINAEVSGGGFPGWLQRVPGTLRSLDQAYLNATALYAQSVGEIIAAAQITNGGPVILFQPENEYYDCLPSVNPCPDPEYMAYVERQFRDAGIVVRIQRLQPFQLSKTMANPCALRASGAVHRQRRQHWQFRSRPACSGRHLRYRLVSTRLRLCKSVYMACRRTTN